MTNRNKNQKKCSTPTQTQNKANSLPKLSMLLITLLVLLATNTSSTISKIESKRFKHASYSRNLEIGPMLDPFRMDPISLKVKVLSNSHSQKERTAKTINQKKSSKTEKLGKSEKNQKTESKGSHRGALITCLAYYASLTSLMKDAEYNLFDLNKRNQMSEEVFSFESNCKSFRKAFNHNENIKCSHFVSQCLDATNKYQKSSWVENRQQAIHSRSSYIKKFKDAFKGVEKHCGQPEAEE